MKSIPAAPAITTQPTSQSTPLGQTATFTVQAAGTPPLQYQWSKNGAAISGASSASFTTPAVVAGDNGSNFTVAVSNNEGSVTSNAASLTVGPRTPQAGDWRFQGIDLPAGTLAGGTNFLSFATVTLPGILGSPLEIGLVPGFACGSADPRNCSWGFLGFNPPSGTTWPTTIYKSDSLANLDADLNALNTGSNVITSLDLQPPNQVFAMSFLQTSTPGEFLFFEQTIPSNQIQAVVAQEGALSHVPTAISFDAAGNAHIVSYGWQSDTTTAYETSVIATQSFDLDTVIADVTNLTQQGYIFTAMGGDATNGLVLIGMRVQGDNLPRPLVLFLDSGNQGQISNSLQAVVRTLFNGNTIQFAQQ